jgi:endonuclease/exonuclease/phosphatase family metal-dependent hydrolase
MRIPTRLAFWAIGAIVLAGCEAGGPFPPARPDQLVTVLSYNVQNLFDAHDDGTEYRDYDPGAGTWNSRLAAAKIRAVADAIEESVPGGPDVIGLQEVENPAVLSELAEVYLSGCGYHWRVCEPAPDAAVNTAVLSRLPVVQARTHLVHTTGSEGLRNILEVRVTTTAGDLVVLNNHWKSKREGEEETEPLRLASAAVVARRLRELAQDGPAAQVLVLGDLNESVHRWAAPSSSQPALVCEHSEVARTERSLFVTTNEARAGVFGPRVVLYSPWPVGGEPGSYWYRGEWERIDHVLLSAGLVDDAGLTLQAFSVVREEFLLTEDGLPRRWNSSAASGYSDHLPLLVTLEAAAS